MMGKQLIGALFLSVVSSFSFANDITGVLVANAGATLAGHTITPFKVVNTVLAGELAKITGWIK